MRRCFQEIFAASFWVLLLLVGLTACTTLQLVEPYDPQIEQSLNDYHKSLVAFVKKKALEGKNAAGAYTSEESRDFYAESEASLSNLIVRASANNPGGTCLTSQAAGFGLSALIASTVSTTTSTSETGASQEVRSALEEIQNGSSELSEGSCTVIILKVVKANHDRLESIHKRQGFLLPPASTIGAELIGDAVQMAITAERAKKEKGAS